MPGTDITVHLAAATTSFLFCFGRFTVVTGRVLYAAVGQRHRTRCKNDQTRREKAKLFGQTVDAQ